VTKLSDSSISRIISGKTYRDVRPDSFERDSIFENRLHILNILLECPEISGGIGLDDNNKLYIQILKRVGLNFAKIQTLYYDISKKAVRRAWDYPMGNIANFDGKQLDITTADIADLLKEKEGI
jgi:hypothetical protein